jgi:peptidoglycan/LPS O-acetylase OafA/YrhL
MATRRDDALDGLRAICAFAVLAVHTHCIANGGIGVDVFFVLSGFLITRNLLKEHAQDGTIDYRTFLNARVVRLIPAYALMLGTYLLFALVVKRGYALHNALVAWGYAATYTEDFARAFFWGPTIPFVHTWSLAIEMQFYLLWPFFLGAVLIRGRRYAFVVIAILWLLIIAWRWYLALHGADVLRIYNGIDTRADALLIGGMAAFLPNTPRLRIFIRRSWLAPAAGLIVAALATIRASTVNEALWFPVWGLLAAWLILGLIEARPAALRWSPLVYLGSISYAIYLWHYPLNIEAEHHLHLPNWAMFGIISMASVAAAAVSWRFVELPASARLRSHRKRAVARAIPTSTLA